MNKVEFIDALAAKANLTKKDAKVALESVLEVITETLTKKEQIAFVGFGTFSTTERAARTATVPGTTKTVEVAATTVPKFKAGKVFKLAVAAK